MPLSIAQKGEGVKFVPMLIAAAVLLLVGCGVQEETPAEEAAEGAGVEEVEPAAPEETKPADGQDDATVLNCQIAKAEADGVDVNELLPEAMENDETVPELLAQMGYACTRAEAQAVIEREMEEARAEHEAARENLEAQGVSEGSASDPARDRCLQKHYEGFSIAQKGEQSRRIDAEAKEQGVSIYDVVGC
jgi:type IV secretory pathway VirB10-like protein